MKAYLEFHPFMLLGLLFSTLPSFALSSDIQKAEAYFQQGLVHFDAKEYDAALPAYQKAIELAPMNATYHHMLGKCYGRLAEQGSWFTALRYVRFTLTEFKKAVELDASNLQAWRDLEEIYRRAPGFLSGDKKKALEIRKYLDEIEPSESAMASE